MELFQSIWQPLVFLLLSMAILVWGADKFVNYSSLLSKKLGINELTIGLTVVALGTSAPEIFVGISSILNESESIAMGAIVGSNISNIALIFGVACFGASMKAKRTPSSQLIPVILSSGMLGIALYDLYVSFLGFDMLLITFVPLYITRVLLFETPQFLTTLSKCFEGVITRSALVAVQPRENFANSRCRLCLLV